jgi:hypothetical protein
MPHYFLHVLNGGTRTLDAEGAEYANLDEAKHEAIESARELVGHAALQGHQLQLSSLIEITNDAGTVLATVRRAPRFVHDARQTDTRRAYRNPHLFQRGEQGR